MPTRKRGGGSRPDRSGRFPGTRTPRDRGWRQATGAGPGLLHGWWYHRVRRLARDAGLGDRCVEPQELLDGDGQQRRFGEEPPAVVGVAAEVGERRTDGAPGRGDPGDEQQESGGYDVAVRHRLAAQFRVHEHGDDVAVPIGMVASVLNVGAEVDEGRCARCAPSRRRTAPRARRGCRARRR